MSVKLLAEHHREFLSLKGGSSESTLKSCRNATLLKSHIPTHKLGPTHVFFVLIAYGQERPVNTHAGVCSRAAGLNSESLSVSVLTLCMRVAKTLVNLCIKPESLGPSELTMRYTPTYHVL